MSNQVDTSTLDDPIDINDVINEVRTTAKVPRDYATTIVESFFDLADIVRRDSHNLRDIDADDLQTLLDAITSLRGEN